MDDDNSDIYFSRHRSNSLTGLSRITKFPYESLTSLLALTMKRNVRIFTFLSVSTCFRSTGERLRERNWALFPSTVCPSSLFSSLLSRFPSFENGINLKIKRANRSSRTGGKGIRHSFHRESCAIV